MARYKLTLAYDGSAFSGSQRQIRHRTVQEELEKSCRNLGWKGRSVVLAGRTDSGVHASGQVAAFDLEWSHSLEAMREALNVRLPLDLAVKSVECAPAGFHPRFDAISRHYQYRLRCEPVRDPLVDRYTWRVWPPVEEGLLDEAAQCFLGQHNFNAFGSASREGGETMRRVTRSMWLDVDGEHRYYVAASGFLYRMVRRLVFVQVAVAQRRCSLETLAEALHAGRNDSELPAGLAPACGLCLIGVEY